MRTTLIRNLGTALTVLALPVMASAQTMGAERVDEVRREASGHVGPLYFTPQVLLKELGVDTNVFNAAGEQKSDFTFTLAPKADAVGAVRAPRAVPGHASRPTSSGTRTTTPSARSIRSSRSAPRSTSTASRSSREGDYLNTRQRLNYEVDLRSRHVENNFTAGIDRAAHAEALASRSPAACATTRFDADAVFDGVEPPAHAQPRHDRATASSAATSSRR